jgi:hypothetical protein
MKRFAIIVIWISLFVLLLLTAPLTTAQQSGAIQSEMDQINQLQKERVEVLSQFVQMMMNFYERGIDNIDINQVVSAKLELINAKLDMTDNLKERITLYEDQLKQVKIMLDFAERRVGAGAGSEMDKLSVRSLYLKTQIDLLKERQKLKEASGRNQ